MQVFFSFSLFCDGMMCRKTNDVFFSSSSCALDGGNILDTVQFCKRRDGEQKSTILCVLCVEMTTVSMDNNNNNNSLRRRRRSFKAMSAAPKILASLLVFGLVLMVLHKSDWRFQKNTQQDREVSLLHKESLPQQQQQQQQQNTLLKSPGTSPQSRTTTTTRKRIPTGPPKKIDEATMPTIYPPKKRQQLLYEQNMNNNTNANATTTAMAKLALAGFGTDEDQIAAMFDGVRSASGEIRLEERTKYQTGQTHLTDEQLTKIRNHIRENPKQPPSTTKRYRLGQPPPQHLPSKKRKRRERETQLYLALKRGQEVDKPLEEDPQAAEQVESPKQPAEDTNNNNNNNINTTRRFAVKGSTKNDDSGPVKPKTREEIAQMSKQAKQAYYNSIANQHKDSLQFMMFESMRQNQMIDPDLETLATQLQQRETKKKKKEEEEKN